MQDEALSLPSLLSLCSSVVLTFWVISVNIKVAKLVGTFPPSRAHVLV